jgi:hypothetical protein
MTGTAHCHLKAAACCDRIALITVNKEISEIAPSDSSQIARAVVESDDERT